jgi:hypothetical protein
MRQERDRRAASMGLVILFATAVGCQATSATSSEPELTDPSAPVGQLELAVGGVSLERGKESLPAETGYLYAKDVLETQEDGKATIRFPGSRTLEISPRARVTIGADRGSLTVRIVRGALSVQVGSSSPSSPFDFWGEQGPKSWLGVQTPYGVARMAPGRNELTLAMVGDSAHLKAVSGSVEVITRGGQATQLAAGEKLTLTLTK